VFNGVLQATIDSGMELSAIQTAGVQRDIMIPIGIRAAPAAGDPCYCCKATHSGFTVMEDGGAMMVNATFGSWDASDTVIYPIPWGQIIVAKSTITVTTTSAAVLGTSCTGGYMMYQVFSGSSGRWTIKLQDSVDDNVYADIEGLTVMIADASSPTAGIVQTTATTNTVDNYIKCVMTEDSAGTIILAVALVRDTVLG
jgi:hypothetical protein